MKDLQVNSCIAALRPKGLAPGWLEVAGLLLVLLAVSALAPASYAGPVTLPTPQGALLGATSQRSDDIAVFKHIPYAKPPVGQRRWRHAEPAAGWTGVRLANRFSPACMQPPYPSESFYSRAGEPVSEDCLYLNVWTPVAALTDSADSSVPSNDREKKDVVNQDTVTGGDAAEESAAQPEPLPVMVWIHGGALTRGSGSTPTYDGAGLATKGVVLVTINYRLGVFGYMAHPEASTESQLGVSGNYGTSDQVQALRWVQDNIAAFGGDPDNVTIFGESAGSWSVHHLLATPSAKGLFHRAIGQSGARFGPMLELKGDASSAHAQGVKLQTGLGIASLAELRDLDAPAVLQAGQRMNFGGVRDGVIFPDQLHRMFAAHRYNIVPLLVGYNADEGTTLGGLNAAPATAEAYEAVIKKRYGPHAKSVLAHYPAADPETASLALMRDSLFGHGMHAWARFNSQQEKDTYLYYFSHQPFGEPLGAFHAAEIAYVFDNVASTGQQAVDAEMAENDQRLAEMMSDYWVAFAKTGKPQLAGAPKWSRYSARKPAYMQFGSDGATRGKDLLGKRWKVLDAVLASRLAVAAGRTRREAN